MVASVGAMVTLSVLVSRDRSAKKFSSGSDTPSSEMRTETSPTSVVVVNVSGCITLE